MSVQEYMNLPYSYVIKTISDENGTYFHGTILELEGCQSKGETFEETYNSLRKVMKQYLAIKLEHGFVIPKPLELENYSGKFLVRLPKSLHRRLAVEAEKEGVSLNQYALYKLSH
ncbi:MAG: toxin-antitoxin system HicB family antitoxin [Clostridia bacterium]